MAEFEDGHIPPFTFDRKSIPDLFGTMGAGYKRFKRCIGRAQDNNVQLIVIVEGTLSEVLSGFDRSAIGGTTMAYKMFTLWAKYGVIPVFTSRREEMAEYITHFFIAIGKQYVERKRG